MRAHLAIAAAAVLFGTTFVVMKDAVALAEPIPFLAVRFAAATIVMAPFARRRHVAAPGLLRAGLWAGVFVLAGYLLQTVGVQYTSSSVSAFLTYLLIIIVPVLSALVLRRPPDTAVLVGVVLATAGLVLLTGGVSKIGRGELLTIGCAFAFAVWVILISEWSPRFDTAAFNVVQNAFVAVPCLVLGFFTGGYDVPLRAWAGSLYTGIVVSAGALWLQVWGQRQVGANRTAVLLMIEPVAAAALGAAVGDRLGLRAAAGAAMILIGVAVAELPIARRLAVARS